MPIRKLLHIVWQNIARSKKNFIFSSIGIIVGISTFTFIIALSQGIQYRVLNRIFPIDQLEIEPVGLGEQAGGEASYRVVVQRPTQGVPVAAGGVGEPCEPERVCRVHEALRDAVGDAGLRGDLYHSRVLGRERLLGTVHHPPARVLDHWIHKQCLDQSVHV